MALLFPISGYEVHIISVLLCCLGIVAAIRRRASIPHEFCENSIEGSELLPSDKSASANGLQTLRDRRLNRRSPPIRLGTSSASPTFTPTSPTSAAATNALAINPNPTNPGSSRGLSKAISSPSFGTHLSPPSTPRPSTYASSGYNTVPASTPTIHRGKRKALLIGLNYQNGKLGGALKGVAPLEHATKDAQRFANALPRLGYASKYTKVITDEKNQPLASAEYLTECMNWLVQDVSPGDRLFFMFSGHCRSPSSSMKSTKSEPYLVAADAMPISQSTLHECLISKVPTGAELIVVLDCCNAAGVVKLKYCIGRMGDNHEMKPTNARGALSELEQSAASSVHSYPHSGSLHGVPTVTNIAPLPSQPGTPVNVNAPSFGSQVGTLHRRPRGSVAAAPIVRIGTEFNSSPAFAQPSTSINPRPGRQAVAEGSPIAPAGRVVVWAGASNHQKAFESSNGVQSGVVTHAICSALEDDRVTQRALWKSLVGAIDEENNSRKERDSKKAKQPAPNLRVQHAEIWSSQEILCTPSTPNSDPFVPWKSGA
ncbi:Metacaspase-1 OS=Ustilago maydis (strain 521 / FGSC 9021) GN=MCA1 PE=3 SV=1 [Rhizoctonia solani AG-1 IB]|uniref:Metacaspase-1 n=1 Tax=Thanatephorus cucumeris (strain AG1-IB / isolate 7/3/14) TaxID=1108050 RepID=A0A0B7F8K5_THACB|nr:Metacaspase-1 OS=Ustilago maydis (strain 521 / FGSC 9021) GN=MCA1 PE=3 SV=1 [Rhizoctonia solani AG-1 IB]